MNLNILKWLKNWLIIISIEKVKIYKIHKKIISKYTVKRILNVAIVVYIKNIEL